MFDPLHKWLGIPPTEQPPNHYRLLGIALWEDDHDVIDAAADRQLTFLHDLTNGAHAKEADQLANRVSAARLCLLNPTRRAAYDATLRGPAASGSHSSASSLPSTSQPTGWHVRHDEQSVYGPYTTETLVEIAKGGRVAADSQIHHETATGGRWVRAADVPPIAAHLLTPAPQISGAVTPRQSTEYPQQTLASRPVVSGPIASAKDRTRIGSRRRPAGRRHWSVTVLQAALPALIILIPVVFVYRRPAIRQRLFAVLGEDSSARQSARETSRRAGAAAARGQAANRTTAPQNRLSARAESMQQRRAEHIRQGNARSTWPPPRPGGEPNLSPAGRSYGTQAGGLPNQNASSISGSSESSRTVAASPPSQASDTIRVKLDLSSSHWTSPLDDVRPGDRLTLASVSDCPTPTHFTPATGRLSMDQETRIDFENMAGLAVELKLTQLGDSGELTLVGQWVYQLKTDKHASFSISRMNKRHQFLSKQLGGPARLQAQLSAERDRLERLISVSRRSSRSDAVVAASRRVQQINSQLPVVEQRARVERQLVEEFQRFTKNVTHLQDSSELVIHHAAGS